MTKITRTYKYRAFAPSEGIDAFEIAVGLKREMWADLCAMEAAHKACLTPLLSVPKAERDADAIDRLRRARGDAIRLTRQRYAARGLEPLVWHDLRRTCGCRLLQEHRMTMPEVSKWLGHASVTTTERSYAFLSIEHLEGVIRESVRTKTGTGAADR